MLKAWLKLSIEAEKCSLGELSIVIGSDNWLKELNNQYLKHNHYTDVITFDTSAERNIINGDILISYDRVKENALELALPFDIELARVMIHGVLHLIGFDDKQPNNKVKMTKKEDYYLEQLDCLRST